MSASIDEVIDLNVGGVHYTTTIRTLTSEQDSLLAKLFSSVPDETNGVEADQPMRKQTMRDQTMRKQRDSSKRVFIDRDGVLFRYVLDYLRNGCRLVLPEAFQERNRLRQEAEYYRLPGLTRALRDVLSPCFRRRSPSPGVQFSSDGGLSPANERGIPESGCILIGYRGTFAFGRDGGVADVKFRKLWRILVSGRVALCKEVFGETLNDSRDPDRGDGDRYSARFFLKHTFLEQAFDALLDSGFRMIGSCGSGTNSAGDIKPGLDTEECRWNHYNEFVFTRP